jgi:hypothetical protein
MNMTSSRPGLVLAMAVNKITNMNGFVALAAKRQV